MKLLIAGGAGYIGSHLIPKLLDRSYEVDVVDLLWFGNHLPDQIKVQQKDIFDLSVEDLKGYDQVIFLAGLSNDPMAEFSPSTNFISNAAAPAYLGYIAKRAGVSRYIYAGSCSVYGYTIDELYDEESPTICSYPYGISKLQGEQASIQMIDDDFSVIAFRQGTVSGYSPRMRFDLVVNTMFKAAMTTGKVTVNNPAIWRPILSIDDAVSAYIRAIEASYKISGIFNIASGNFTVGELGDIVKEVLEEEFDKHIDLEIKHIEDFRNYKVTVEKAITTLSFKPKHSVENIVRSLIENLSKYPNLDDPQYQNIQVFMSNEIANKS